MHHRRILSWISLFAAAVVVLAGCAPRAFSGVTSSQAAPDALVVDLPALVVDIDSAGTPSIGNVPLAQLGAQFAPGLLDSFVIPSDTVAFLTDSNIQHIQIDNSPNGLLLLVNGEPIPSIKWDGEILAGTAGLFAELGVGAAVLEKLLPIVTNLGIGVIVRFPVQNGAQAIPTYIPDGAAAVAARAAQQEFLAQVGDNPPTIKVPVFYDEQGGWRVGDLTDAEWTNLTGIPFQAARLTPDFMQQIVAGGITDVSVYTTPAGLHLSINGRALPYIGWADGEIIHALDLAEQMNLWDTLADSGMNMGEIVGMVETLLPVVQSTNTSINVYFPGSLAYSQQ